MADPKIIEAAAFTLHQSDGLPYVDSDTLPERYYREARAVLAAVEPLIRADERAKIKSGMRREWRVADMEVRLGGQPIFESSSTYDSRDIAESIRETRGGRLVYRDLWESDWQEVTDDGRSGG